MSGCHINRFTHIAIAVGPPPTLEFKHTLGASLRRVAGTHHFTLIRLCIALRRIGKLTLGEFLPRHYPEPILSSSLATTLLENSRNMHCSLAMVTGLQLS